MRPVPPLHLPLSQHFAASVLLDGKSPPPLLWQRCLIVWTLPVVRRLLPCAVCRVLLKCLRDVVPQGGVC